MRAYLVDCKGSRQVRFIDLQGKVRAMRVGGSIPFADEVRKFIDRAADRLVTGEAMGDADRKVLDALRQFPRALRVLSDAGLVRVCADESVGANLDDWRDSFPSTRRERARTQRSRASSVLVDLCGFRTIRDIDLVRVRKAIDSMQAGGVPSHTIHAKAVAVKQFAKWLASADSGRRLHESPLKDLPVPQGESVRQRRALSVSEQRDLLRIVPGLATYSGTRGDGVRWELTGDDRRLLYWFTLETGLRAKEVRQVERRYLTLDDDRPRFTMPAASTKSKRGVEMSLSPALADALREHCRNKAHSALLFVTPTVSGFSKMIRRDLAHARAAWIKEAAHDPAESLRRSESDYLASQNKRGEVVDFHALRVSAISSWVEAGMPLQRVQERARHKDLAITLRIYTKVTDAMRREDVRFLPALAESVTKTVTTRAAVGDGVVCHSVDTVNAPRLALSVPACHTHTISQALDSTRDSIDRPDLSLVVNGGVSAGGGT